MTTADIIYEKVHFRHNPKWSVRLRPAEGGLLCLACVIEIIEAEEIAVTKTRFLSLLSILKCP